MLWKLDSGHRLRNDEVMDSWGMAEVETMAKLMLDGNSIGLLRLQQSSLLGILVEREEVRRADEGGNWDSDLVTLPD
jgi:hypothetical protein